eukprot:5216911-Alexandrium_andersonii.AAC.1
MWQRCLATQRPAMLWRPRTVAHLRNDQRLWPRSVGAGLGAQCCWRGGRRVVWLAGVPAIGGKVSGQRPDRTPAEQE